MAFTLKIYGWGRRLSRKVKPLFCNIKLSLWELYSRIPDLEARKHFGEEIYPYLTRDYNVWLNELDKDKDLLVATANNWDDNPRYDLAFREITDQNGWWGQLEKLLYNNTLEDPASSSQLGYGPIIMSRLARDLGKTEDAEKWKAQIPKHEQAVNTLWDEERGYWIVYPKWYEATYPQYKYSPSEWYNSKDGSSQNSRAFSWTSSVAIEMLLKNYQNERVLGSCDAKDGKIEGQIREIYDFDSRESLLRVEPRGLAFPKLTLTSEDGLPIQNSATVSLKFSDPAGNYKHRDVYLQSKLVKRNIVDDSGKIVMPKNEAYIVRMNTTYRIIKHD